VIGAFRPLQPAEVVLGQFAGYRDIKGVAEDSRTETFVAARLWVDTARWRGVPFLLRTGKQMAASRQQVQLMFRQPAAPVPELPASGNVLTFDLAGEGELDLSLVVKEPGPTLALSTARSSLPLRSVPGAHPLQPYVRLIHDVLLGDRSLFTRPDGLEHVWEVAAAVLAGKPEPVIYPRGSWGPAEADRLAEPIGWLLNSPDKTESTQVG
jgi:glucose-6-phosphate 1-dehydrogenase